MSLLSFALLDRANWLTLAASQFFDAKGNPFGRFLTVVFSCLYGYINWQRMCIRQKHAL